jgi:hypothetical protein
MGGGAAYHGRAMRPFPQWFFLLGLLLAVAAPPATAQDLELVPQRTRWRLTLEHADPDGTDELGLLGLHYDVFDPLSRYPNAYVGLGAYAGVWGDRGGYLALGVEGGWRLPLVNGWAFETGMFVGGGGSDFGDDGSGLMLRPHVALEAPLNRAWAWRMEVAYAASPGGDLNGLQLALGFSGTRQFLTSGYSAFELDPLAPTELNRTPLRLEPSLLYFDPSSGTRRSFGQANSFTMLGVRTHHALGRNVYLPIEYAAAVGGDAGGYRQFMFGIGEWGPRFTPHVWGVKEVLVGAGGGGGYDTGGGALVQVNAGLEFPLKNDWSASIKGGYLTAIDGNFDGWTLQAAASWSPSFYSTPRNFDIERFYDEGLSEDDATLDDYIISLRHKSIAIAGNVRDANGNQLDNDLQLIGLGLQRQIVEDLDVELNTFTAWDGDVGGYHELGLGLRYRVDVLQPWQTTGQFYLKYQLGSAGGGVDNRSGLFHEVGAGWRFTPSEGLWVAAELARIDSDRGTFGGDVFGLHLEWAFSRPRVAR